MGCKGRGMARPCRGVRDGSRGRLGLVSVKFTPDDKLVPFPFLSMRCNCHEAACYPTLTLHNDDGAAADR